ncbi:MAG: hypothetical protein ABSG67_15495 [Thermoguttaceae bacterium]
MSSTKTETALPQSPKKGVQALLQDARIDAAHTLNGPDSDLVSAAVSDSGIDANIDSDVADSAENVPVHAAEEFPKDDITSEQLQRQAEQLAHFLRDRQRELDHREAHLNAEIAQLETDLRKERLCFSEREAEQELRRQELDNREKEILERLERLAAADAALKRKTGAEAELAARSAGQTLENAQSARQAWNLNDQRQRQLEEAENRLAQAQAETQKFQEQLTAQRRELREEIHRERQRLIREQRQTLAELEKKREVLERRAKHAEQCRTGLLELRGELQQMHRETLEIRLATEELWIKLSGAAPPDALTHPLGRIRNRLADQYRLANAELLKQKEELEGIRDQLVEQYRNLVEQKQQFEGRMDAGREESQQQAAMLIAREQALLEQQTRFEEESQQWRVARMQYEQEIRLLRLELARQGAETANA